MRLHRIAQGGLAEREETARTDLWSSVQQRSSMSNRLQHLDGLRGLAILLVVLFHAYARWSTLMPYGADYAELPVVKFGWLGVQLFFLISGFVILMTLERCPGRGPFLVRRWLRLFPAMLLVSALVYGSASLFHARPAGMPRLVDLLPGLTFIEPDWWSRVLRTQVEPLEGAFWSLFVEFKFYVIAAAIYYWRGRNPLLLALSAAYALDLLARWGALPAPLLSLCKHLSLEHFGWFAAGAAFYVHVREQQRRWFGLGLALAVLSALTLERSDMPTRIAALAVVLVFAAAIRWPLLQRALATPALQFLGFVSYPLYLLHENLMIALVVQWGGTVPAAWTPLLPLVVIAALALLAGALATHGEPLIQRWLSRPLRPLLNT